MCGKCCLLCVKCATVCCVFVLICLCAKIISQLVENNRATKLFALECVPVHACTWDMVLINRLKL